MLAQAWPRPGASVLCHPQWIPKLRDATVRLLDPLRRDPVLGALPRSVAVRVLPSKILGRLSSFDGDGIHGRRRWTTVLGVAGSIAS